jgi:hypothetical protein
MLSRFKTQHHKDFSQKDAPALEKNKHSLDLYTNAFPIIFIKHKKTLKSLKLESV